MITRTLVVLVSVCRIASAESATESAPSEPTDEGDVCHGAKLYVAPSLFVMSGSPWTTDAGGTMSTSGENTFHRIAAGALLRLCERLPRIAARIGATGALHTNVSGFGVEAELDYGAGSRFEGGLRLGVELGLNSHIVSAGPRVHVFETAFFGVDAYTARDASYASRGVMFGFGLEGRAGRWASIAEAAAASIMLGVVLATGGPD